MKKFNVPQFYNGFCCYLKSTCFSFDNVIMLFTLSCLHPHVITLFRLIDCKFTKSTITMHLVCGLIFPFLKLWGLEKIIC